MTRRDLCTDTDMMTSSWLLAHTQLEKSFPSHKAPKQMLAAQSESVPALLRYLTDSAVSFCPTLHPTTLGGLTNQPGWTSWLVWFRSDKGQHNAWTYKANAAAVCAASCI